MAFENQNIINSSSDKKPEISAEDPNTKRLRIFLTQVFDNGAEASKRTDEFEKRLKSFLVVGDGGCLSQFEIDGIRNKFQSYCSLEDKEEFIKQGLDSLKPLIEWKKNNEAAFEAKMRENFVSASGFTRLNESLSYGKDKDDIHIHVAPSETLSVGQKLNLLKDGLRRLQEIVKNDEEIKLVSATSWIIATEKGQGIMEKLGFEVTGLISKELKERFFRSETRPVFGAYIKREDFLKPDRYK